MPAQCLRRDDIGSTHTPTDSHPRAGRRRDAPYSASFAALSADRAASSIDFFRISL
jgi:hypothetical protein